MKRLGNYLISILFIGCIIIIGAYIQFSPKSGVSFYENRTLAESPELTLANVANGSFTKDYETFFTDHFAGKGLWVQGYLNWQKFTNQTFINDYFISKDDWVYPKPINYLSYENIDKTMGNLKGLADYTQKNGVELFFFSLPNRYLILDADFPSYVSNGYEQMHKKYFLDELAEIENINALDMTVNFKEKYSHEELKSFYYQTDHHWNADGAFEGYQLIYNKLNQDSALFQEPAFNPDNFTKTCYENERFIGSYNRQLYEMIKTNDSVCTILPNTMDYNNFEVYTGAISEETKVPWNKVYGKDLGKDLRVIDYAGIFAADYKELNIINPQLKNKGTKVLFIKDSYANPMTFWLSQHFYQTTFFDIRHNQDRTLYEFLENNDFDMIAFLYNDTTIFPAMYDFNLTEK